LEGDDLKMARIAWPTPDQAETLSQVSQARLPSRGADDVGGQAELMCRGSWARDWQRLQASAVALEQLALLIERTLARRDADRQTFTVRELLEILDRCAENRVCAE